MISKEEMIAFEKDIADEYCKGKIRAPIHLSDGNEDQLIEVFKNVNREDWVYSTWRSHYHALLHGIPKDLLHEKIMQGDSITIMCPEYRFFTSAIVGGIIPIAMGTALGIKRQGGSEKVWCFVGDMTSETVCFYFSLRFANNFDLPITFVIEDNEMSVGSPTSVVWGHEERQPKKTMPYQVSRNIWKYDYVKSFPHVGAGRWIVF